MRMKFGKNIVDIELLYLGGNSIRWASNDNE